MDLFTSTSSTELDRDIAASCHKKDKNVTGEGKKDNWDSRFDSDNDEDDNNDYYTTSSAEAEAQASAKAPAGAGAGADILFSEAQIRSAASMTASGAAKAKAKAPLTSASAMAKHFATPEKKSRLSAMLEEHDKQVSAKSKFASSENMTSLRALLQNEKTSASASASASARAQGATSAKSKFASRENMASLQALLQSEKDSARASAPLSSAPPPIRRPVAKTTPLRGVRQPNIYVNSAASFIQ